MLRENSLGVGVSVVDVCGGCGSDESTFVERKTGGGGQVLSVAPPPVGRNNGRKPRNVTHVTLGKPNKKRREVNQSPTSENIQKHTQLTAKEAAKRRYKVKPQDRIQFTPFPGDTMRMLRNFPNTPGAIACETDPALFFSYTTEDINTALKTCTSCPARTACALYTMELLNPTNFPNHVANPFISEGIWAGEHIKSKGNRIGRRVSQRHHDNLKTFLEFTYGTNIDHIRYLYHNNPRELEHMRNSSLKDYQETYLEKHDPLTFIIPSTPQQKGSKNVSKYGAIYDTNQQLSKYRQESIQHLALLFTNHIKPVYSVKTPVQISLEFFIPLPKSKKTTYKGPHISKPDIDKLARTQLDLFTGIIYHDDRQVNSISASKYYCAAPEGYTKVTITTQAPPSPTRKQKDQKNDHS